MPSAYGRPTPVSRCRLGRSLKSWNRYRLRIFTLGHGYREPRRARAPYVPWIGAIAALLALCTPQVATAQLNENCTVSVLNRKVRVNPDGSWILPNVPANFGQVKARATCVQNGVTTFGESAYFAIPANGAVNLGRHCCPSR